MIASVASVSFLRELRDLVGGFGLSAKHRTCICVLHRLHLMLFWSWSKSSAHMGHPVSSFLMVDPAVASSSEAIVGLREGFAISAASCS